MNNIEFSIISEEKTNSIYKIIRDRENDECRSDLSLPYLLTYWRLVKPPRYTFLNNNLVLELYDPAIPGNCIAIIGNENLNETINNIFIYQTTNSLNNEVSMLNEEQAKLLLNYPKFKINNDTDLDEYIINLNEYCNLRGKKLKSNRQAINNFSRKYGNNLNMEILDSIDDLIIKSLVNSMHIWEQKRSTNHDPSGTQLKYLEKMLLKSSLLGIKCAILKFNNSIIGFCIFSKVIEKKFGIAHIAIVDHTFVNSYDYLVFRVCEHLKNNGYQYLNIEEDMGIEGIKFKKQHMNPCRYQKRYSVTKN